jgi:hypothetical protein
MASRKFGARKHHRTGSDHTTLSHLGAIQYHRMVFDYALIAHLAGVYRGVETDGDDVSDDSGEQLMCDMDRGTRA